MKNQIYATRYLKIARFISICIAPFYSCLNFFRQNSLHKDENIQSIVISQYHRIGDVLMIIPVFTSLRKKYPNAKLTLLCCNNAEPLIKSLNVVDEIIGIEIPWVDWNWSPLKWWKVRSFVRKLGKRKIDLVIDFKGDLRDSWFVWNLKAKMSLGYIDTGGSFFYTHPQIPPLGVHQTIRALQLIRELGCNIKLDKVIKRDSETNGSIVLHPGGSHPLRSWSCKKWMDLTIHLSKKYKISLVKTSETDPIIQNLKEKNIQFEVFEGTLVLFKEWLKKQKLLISIDSMAGHLAAYLGLPVISIFGSQNPDLTRPLGKNVRIISPKYPCSHRRIHWRLCQDCMESIEVHTVRLLTEKILSNQG